MRLTFELSEARCIMRDDDRRRGFLTLSWVQEQGGYRYDPPISCGAMLLRNITTALKFYLSSPLIQVDQVGGGGSGMEKPQKCACMHLLYFSKHFLRVYLSPLRGQSMQHPPPCCVSGGADCITMDVKIHLGKRPLVAGDDDSKGRGGKGGGGTISSK